MDTKKQPASPPKVSYPGKRPEIDPDKVPEHPILPDQDLDIIPDEEDSFETTPEEVPPPGEKP